MNVEIITIGDELLIGQVTDTNSAWMGQILTKNGFEVSKKVTIPDVESIISKTIKDSLNNVDILLITGGLGPTNDDVTKKTLCDYFKCSLVFNDEVFEDLKSFLNSEDQDINALNRDQALVPDNCTIFRNRVGTAPTMLFKQNNKVVISMPGVPYEMKKIMEDNVIPWLRANYYTTEIVNKTLIVSGIPESDLSISLKDIESSLPAYIKLAYLPSPTSVRLRLTGKGESLENMEDSINLISSKIKKIIGKALWSKNDEPPEIMLGKKLTKSGETISCAESCTGGNIAHKLTKHSGSSAFFQGGVVAYHNHIKEDVLGVKHEDLERYGAVSKSVVEQMALGVKKLMNTDWAVATSGVAGPTGGSDEKPVGTVWIAWAGPDGVESRRFQFGKNRDINIISATETALVGFLTL